LKGIFNVTHIISPKLRGWVFELSTTEEPADVFLTIVGCDRAGDWQAEDLTLASHSTRLKTLAMKVFEWNLLIFTIPCSGK